MSYAVSLVTITPSHSLFQASLNMSLMVFHFLICISVHVQGLAARRRRAERGKEGVGGHPRTPGHGTASPGPPAVLGKWRECLLGALVDCKKGLDLSDVMAAVGGWEGLEHLFPVAFGMQAGIQNGHDAAIAARAEQTADALLQAQHGLREDVRAEPVFARGLHMGDARFVDGIVRRIERKFVDDDQREGVARDIHAFPEALQAEQDRALFLTK